MLKAMACKVMACRLMLTALLLEAAVSRQLSALFNVLDTMTQNIVLHTKVEKALD